MTAGPGLAALRRRARDWPAGHKVAALAASGLLLFLIASPVAAAVAAALALAASLALLGARASLSLAGSGLWLAVAAVVVLAAVFEGPDQAVLALFRIVALVVLAHLVTATTPAGAMQDALVAALRPFERLPFVSADKAGLALAVALRSLPRLKAAFAEIRDAQAARGLRAGPAVLLVPLVARVIRLAEETADAIDARCWSGTRPEGCHDDP